MASSGIQKLFNGVLEIGIILVVWNYYVAKLLNFCLYNISDYILQLYLKTRLSYYLLSCLFLRTIWLVYMVSEEVERGGEIYVLCSPKNVCVGNKPVSIKPAYESQECFGVNKGQPDTCHIHCWSWNYKCPLKDIWQ